MHEHITNNLKKDKVVGTFPQVININISKW